MRKGLIYCIKNKVNNKVYIGQTVDIKSRWRKHKRKLRKNIHQNPYLQNAWNKYGKNNFIWLIIEKNIPTEELNKKEISYIKKYKSYKNGYNLTKGGEGTRGYNLTYEQKKNLSDINENVAIKIYESFKSKNKDLKINELASKYNVSKRTVANIISCNHWATKKFSESRDKEKEKYREKVIEIYNKYRYCNQKYEYEELAKIYNLSRRTVARIVNCKHEVTKHLKSERDQWEDRNNIGREVSQETRKKISKAKRGRKLTKEHRRKLSESHKGQKISKENLEKLIKVNRKITKKQGVEIYKRYNSKENNLKYKDLMEEYNLSKSSIGAIVNAKHWTTKEFNNNKEEAS